MGCLKSFQDVLRKEGNEETTSGKKIRILFNQKDNLFPRNLQQDPLNGPLHLSKSNSSSNLLRGPLVRPHSAPRLGCWFFSLFLTFWLAETRTWISLTWLVRWIGHLLSMSRVNCSRTVVIAFSVVEKRIGIGIYLST